MQTKRIFHTLIKPIITLDPNPLYNVHTLNPIAWSRRLTGMEGLFPKLSDEMLQLGSVRQKEDVTSAELKSQSAKARIGAQILIGLVERGTNYGHFVFIGLLCIAVHHRHLLFIAIFRPLALLQPTHEIPSLYFLFLVSCPKCSPTKYIVQQDIYPTFFYYLRTSYFASHIPNQGFSMYSTHA